MSYLTNSAEQNIIETKKQKEKFDTYLWYGMIIVISLVALIFLPMIGSELPVSLLLPKTFSAWLLFIFTKLTVAILNVLIFHCFLQQGDVNVKYYYKRRIADEILARLNINKYIPLGPDAWRRKEYKHKGTTVVITSILSAFCIAQAVLSFDWKTFLSYVITVFLGIIFGVLQMKKTEIYYSGEYFDYAIMEMKAYNEMQDEEEEKLSVIITAKLRQLLKGDVVVYDYYDEFPSERPGYVQHEEIINFKES